MLDLRRMEVLATVARHGSFTAAAKAMDYSQSAVSQQIATLERETGTELVVRSGRRTWLTDAGTVLVAHARQILAAIADAEADLAAVADLRTGTVRLAAFPSAGATLIPRVAAIFRREHRGVELVVTGAEPSAAVEGLRNGVYDLAVTLAEPGSAQQAQVRQSPELNRVPLLDDPFFVVLPGCHRLADQEQVALADLADEHWIATSPHGHPDAETLLRVCASAGFTPNVVFHIDDYMAVQGFVAARVGVSLIPELALTAVRDDVAVRRVTPATHRRVEAVTVASRRLSPAVRAALDVLRTITNDAHPTT